MIRIVRVPFLIPTWAVAQVLVPGVVFVRRDVILSERLLAHELRHVDQIQERGVVRYWAAYLLGLIPGGYETHPMEIPARHAETDAAYRRRARDLLSEEERRAER